MGEGHTYVESDASTQGGKLDAGRPLTEVATPVGTVTILPTCGSRFMESSEEQHCEWLMAPFMAKVTDYIRDFNNKMKPDLGEWF